MNIPKPIQKLKDELCNLFPGFEFDYDHEHSGVDNYRLLSNHHVIDIRDANSDKSRFYVDIFEFETGRFSETLNLYGKDLCADNIIGYM